MDNNFVKDFLSFTQFLESTKQSEHVKFNPETMKWITIHDKNNKLQRILINKKDGTILGGMGGTETGNKIGDMFDDEAENRDETNTVESFRKKALKGVEVNEKLDISKLKISPKKLKDIKEYISDEKIHLYINKMLRDKYSYKKIPKTLFYKYEKYIESLSSVLKEYKTPEPIITYRGINSSTMNKLLNKIKVGMTWTDDGFMSTSSSSYVARKLFSNSDDGYILEVHIPKGSHALSVDSISPRQGKELEVIIDKGSKCIIKEIDHKNRVVVMELKNVD